MDRKNSIDHYFDPGLHPSWYQGIRGNENAEE